MEHPTSSDMRCRAGPHVPSPAAAALAATGMALLAMPGCKHEATITPHIGGGSCDTATVWFQQQVLPLLISNCAVPGCHDEATAGNGWTQITDHASIMAGGIVQSGSLYDRLTDPDPGRVMPPPGQPGLTAGQIALIREWIDQGARDNSCASPCDTASVTYSGTIVPLVQQRCAGCHGGANPQGGLNFSAYAVLHAVALDGRLAASVTHDPQSTPMPPFGPMLPQCDIDRILIWVQDGAPNN